MRPVLYYILAACFSRKPLPALTCAPSTVCLMTPCPSRMSSIGTFSRTCQLFPGRMCDTGKCRPFLGETNQSKINCYILWRWRKMCFLNFFGLFMFLFGHPLLANHFWTLFLACDTEKMLLNLKISIKKTGDERTDLSWPITFGLDFFLKSFWLFFSFCSKNLQNENKGQQKCSVARLIYPVTSAANMVWWWIWDSKACFCLLP